MNQHTFLNLPGVHPVEPDFNAILHFLRTVLRDEVHLVAITPDAPKGRGITGKWFGADHSAAAVWAEDQNRKGRNVYLTGARVRPALDKKPKKSDVVSSRFCHLDIDPKEGWNKEAAIADLQKRARPTVIWDSGNGIQALWRLAGESSDQTAVELANRGLGAAFDADDCANCDRALRLAGTVNFPDAKKRAAGRFPVLSKLVQDESGESFDLTTLHQYFPAPIARDIRAIRVDWIDAPTRPEYTGPADDNALIEKALKWKGSTAVQFESKPNFRDLWEAKADRLATFFPPEGGGKEFNHSAADFDLMNWLAYATGCNPVRMDNLFRRGALMRDKYARREDYRISTIEKAISGCTKVYDMPEGPQVAEIDNVTVDGSEDSIAALFVSSHQRKWRYCAGIGWLEFAKDRWAKSQTVENDIRAVCAKVAFSIPGLSPSQHNRIRSHKTISAVRRLAETDPAMLIDAKEFDSDPMLLGTPGGIVDLRTGILRPASPEDRIMQMTAVAPSDAENCPLWLRFFNDTFGHDPALHIYVSRVVGYCLTGSTKHEEIYHFHGVGGDGKGTFLKAIADMMGDYAKAGTPETILNTKQGQHLTFIAAMKGKRFVYFPEMPGGRVTWNEQRLKQLSSGDVTEANTMHSDPIQFTPTAKLFVAGNELISFVRVGEDIRRRFRLVEFHKVPDEKKDKDLKEKLRGEFPGILRWAINRCLEWQAFGLLTPDYIKAATEDYLDDNSDPIAEWLASESIEDRDATIKNETIIQSHNTWREKNELPKITRDLLTKKLKSYGLLKYRSAGGKWRGWKGRRFKKPDGSCYYENPDEN